MHDSISILNFLLVRPSLNYRYTLLLLVNTFHD
jgi:hypothetical protein